MRRRSTRESLRGSALASTLLVILFLVVFGFTLANLATFDVRTVNRNGQKQLALNAAQAGLESVISKLSLNPKLDQTQQVFQETLADGSSYKVTFDSGTEPWSKNNLGGLSSVTGYKGRSVPAFHASIFSKGKSPSGETALVESLIRLEAIPYAVAGTGQVKLTNSQIYAVQDTSSATHFDAHVYSGDPGAGSLELNGVTTVTGDARSHGGISVAGASTVEGDVDPFRNPPETLPNLDIELFRNDTVPGVDARPGGLSISGSLSGPVYIDGSVTFLAVTLNNASVFVDGDLTVLTALSGTGSIFVNGSTNITIPALSMSGSDRVAIFSERDITLAALGTIQGILYSHGDIRTLLAITVRGAVYAVNVTDSSKGNVTLGLPLIGSTTVVHVPEITSFASYWLGVNGEADAVQVYWRRIY